MFPYFLRATHMHRNLTSMLLGLSMCVIGLSAAADATPVSLAHGLFMRGQIVDVDNATLVVCIGRSDGAEVGQELDVIHHRRTSIGPKGVGRFKRDTIGKIRINAILDEHYAEATLVSGKASQYDTVELIKPKQDP